MFVEKYRPKEFSNVVGLNDSIANVTSKGDIPHLLFFGSPGTGKTTTALIIVNKLKADCLMLNASDERKIEVIRNKVKGFASTKSTNDKLKIVFLDEADALTPDAQNALRNMMETFYSNCRFILTGNTINKITPAIQSRCQKFKFELPKKDDIFNRLMYIVEQENINIKEEPLRLIIDNHYPDIRSCINKLDALHQEGVEITNQLVNKDQMIVADLFKKLQSEKLSVIRQWILDNNTDYSQLTKDMSLYIWNNLSTVPNAVNVLLQVGELNRYINQVVDQDIEFTDRLLQIKKIMAKK